MIRAATVIAITKEFVNSVVVCTIMSCVSP